MAGWIKIHRDIQQHWIAQDMEKFGWWIDLLLLASYEDNKTFMGNRIAEVKRGQLVASLRFLAERWKTSKDRVNAFLKLLVQEGMIHKESDKNTTLVTICNYESYQDVQDTFETPSRHLQDTSETPSRQTKEIQEIQEINNNNLNARTREERVAWIRDREVGFGEQAKAAQIMALGRKFSLTRAQVIQQIDAFLDKCQIGDHGHRDIGHFGNHLSNFIEEELKRMKPIEQPKKVVEGKEIFNLYK